MSEIWDDRKKALEDEHFRKKDQEAIEKLRAKRSKGEGSVGPCPKCGGALTEISYEGIQIDRCTSCNGVWLDAGELEQVTKHEDKGGWFDRLWKSFSD